MRRRDVLGMVPSSLLGLLCPRARAQANPLPGIGIVVVGRSDGRPAPLARTIGPALAALGWVDGTTAQLLVRDAQGRLDRLGALIEELVRLPVDVLVVGGAVVAQEAVRVTQDIPIIVSGTGIDPVRAGWAQSYSRPGRNITGLTLANDEVIDKQLEALKTAAPSMRHVGILATRGNASKEPTVRRAEAVTAQMGLKASPGFLLTQADVGPEIDRLRETGVEALVVLADPAMDNLRNSIAEHAIKSRLPTIGQLPFYGEAGFLLVYAADLQDIHQRTAIFVDRILKGTKVSELPFESPSLFSLTLNLQTARQLNLEVPPALLAQADEVIE
ncbi:ABC transporter substrate-binding protein [Microvirga arabica]|uniref:ABC transporter substrate-binding protein n=1 Tax=Microvirga arabica TaxID=1128671 RepID=UPI00193A3BF1|nr:ABC transporter substrate-binding protein [Microvirga arabica]MBM1172678.1 ABC transporter substrate-binding protein [Microvirga arabica]